MQLPKKHKIIWHGLFDNNLSLPVNFMHYTYDAIARVYAKISRKFSYDEVGEKIAAEIKSQGYSIQQSLIPDELFGKIKTKLYKAYEEKTSLNTQYNDAGLIWVNNVLKYIPECIEVMEIPAIKGALHKLYGSGYRLFNVTTARTFGKPDKNLSFGSDVWHNDNLPTNHVKLMIYFTDVCPETGAMKIVNKEASRKIKKAGFIRRKYVEPLREEIEKNAISTSAPAKSGIFFLPQYCIHSAVEPMRDSRDVIVFMFTPYIGVHKIETDAEKEKVSNSHTYIVNPFTGKNKTPKFGGPKEKIMA